MSEDKEFNPLLSIGMQYIQEAASYLNAQQLDALQQVLEDLITNKIDFKTAIKSYKAVLVNTTPLEKVNAILLMDEKPLPCPKKNKKNFYNDYDYVISTKKKSHPWTDVEDLRLLAGIHRFGMNSWLSISNFVGNGRTRAQCSQRWFRVLDPRISKVVWTKNEDEKLLGLVRRFSDRAWTKISSCMGNRSDAQCRYRYSQLKKREIGKNAKENKTTPNTSISKPIDNEYLPRIIEFQNVMRVPVEKIKIPSISSFENEIEKLPNHLKFQLIAPEFVL